MLREELSFLEIVIPKGRKVTDDLSSLFNNERTINNRFPQRCIRVTWIFAKDYCLEKMKNLELNSIGIIVMLQLSSFSIIYEIISEDGCRESCIKLCEAKIFNSSSFPRRDYSIRRLSLSLSLSLRKGWQTDESSTT